MSLYPCPFCHMALTWVPEHQQYYCYFCHRYVPAGPPAYPIQPPQVPPPYQQQPIQTAQTQQHAPPPVHAERPHQGAPPAAPAAQPAQSTVPAAVPTPATAPPPHPQTTPDKIPAEQGTRPKPAVEYVQAGAAEAPPTPGQGGAREPIFLCKACGSRLDFYGQHQRWFCPRCQQYK
jgi:hypothetical protein